LCNFSITIGRRVAAHASPAWRRSSDEVLDRRLDRIQRRERPRPGSRPSFGVGRHQRFGSFGDVQHDGARFEQRELARLDGGHLAERLQRAIAGARLVLWSDQLLLIGHACFLERPAHANVAHQALRKRRHPTECAQLDHRRIPCFFSIDRARRHGRDTAARSQEGSG
jgi:hypothetical protein